MGKSFIFIAAIFLTTLIYGQGVSAFVDLSVGMGGRSYPKSGSAEADLGLHHVFWGKGKSSSGNLDPFYGYIRPYAKPGVSVNYDSLETGIEFFPISFFGARAFTKRSTNRGNIEAFDCITLDCKYKMENQNVEGDLALGYKSVFLGVRVGHQKFFELDNENQTTPIVDPRSGLSWVPNEDDEMNYAFCFLGYRISEAWQVIGLYSKYEMDRTGDESNSGYLFLNRNWGSFTAGLGAGVFKSALKEEKGSVIFNLKWNLLEGPGLF